MDYRIILVKELTKRDGDFCQLCKKPFTSGRPAEIDHKVSQFNNGVHELENLQLLHKSCNSTKGIGNINGKSNINNQEREQIVVFELCGRDLSKMLEIIKYKIIRSTMIRTNNNIAKTSRILKVERTHIYRALQKYNLPQSGEPWSIKVIRYPSV